MPCKLSIYLEDDIETGLFHEISLAKCVFAIVLVTNVDIVK